MSNKKGRETKIARTTYVIIAAVLVVTGATSLIAWGSKGFEDWNVPGWFGYVPAPEVPAVPAAPEEVTPAGYKFVMQSEAVAQSESPRAVSSEAEAEFAKILSENSGKDLTTGDYLSKIIVKNDVDNKTVTAASAGIKVAVINVGMKTTAIFVPRYNPFDQPGYIYNNSHYYLNSNPSDIKDCMYETFCTYYNMFQIDIMEISAANFPRLTVVYELQTDPNAVQPLPPAPEKEGYTFAGWYYGTDAEHGDNCTPYTSDVVTGNINLHAHFNINRYNVTFDAAGGKDIQAQVVDWNTVLTPPTPERTGYDFKGWFLEDGTEYSGQAIKEDITLTAKWQIKTFTVTFYVGGEVYATRTVDYGTTFAELAEEAKDLNLKVLTVMTEQGEQPVDEISGMPITGDYSVMGENLNVVERVQHFIKNYPWIFFAVGAGLSVIIGLIGRVCYNKALEQAYARRNRNSRNGRRY